MKTRIYRIAGRREVSRAAVGFGVALLLGWGMATSLHADEVEMQNGDHYTGKVASLNGQTLVLQSEVLGTVRLARGKVARITLGTTLAASGPGTATNVQFRPYLAPAVTNSELTSLRQLGSNTNLIRQVQQQFLGDAGPEATAKFNELLGGLASGKLSVSELRTEAKAAAERLRGLRKELGEDAGPMLDSYLAILDKFVREVDSGSETNATAASSKP